MRNQAPTLLSTLAAISLYAAQSGSAQTCTPYLPDGGLFITTSSTAQNIAFNPVIASPPAQPVRAGLYSISMNSARQVVVVQGNATSGPLNLNSAECPCLLLVLRM